MKSAPASDTSTLAAVERLCAERQLRFTALRRRVFAWLWHSQKPLKPYELLERLGAQAHPPTIYRTLDFLKQHRLIHHLPSLGAYLCCKHPQAHAVCCVFLCPQCQAARECCDAGFEAQLHGLAQTWQVELQPMAVEIQALCAGCQNP